MIDLFSFTKKERSFNKAGFFRLINLSVGMIFIISASQAQRITSREEADSIYNTIVPFSYDSASLDKITLVLNYYYETGNKRQDSLINSLFRISEKFKRDDLWARFYYEKAKISRKANKDELLPFLDSAFYYARKCKNDYLLVQSLALAGFILRKTGKLDKAFEYMMEALTISEKNKFTGFLPYRYFDLAILYSAMGDTIREYEMNTMSYRIARDNNNVEAVGYAAERLALMEARRKNFSRAFQLNQQADSAFKTMKLEERVVGLNLNVGRIFMQAGQPDSAVQYLTYVLYGVKQPMENGHIENALRVLADAYYEMNRLDSAVFYVEKYLALMKDHGKAVLAPSFISRISQIYEGRGDFKKAFQFLKEYVQIKDSLRTVESHKAMQDLAVKYETERKEQNILLLEIEKKGRENEMARQHWINFGIGIFGLLIIIILVVLIRVSNLKRQADKIQAESEKQQRILKERNRIASELHDDLGSGLTKISLLSQVAGSMGSDKQQQTLEKITGESSAMVDKMNSIIWALNTNNDSLANLLSFSRKQAYDLFEYSPIKLLWEVPDTMSEVILSGEFRRNIYLVMKEVFHNALKYSDAGFVKVNVVFENDCLTIIIKDDGVGFDLEGRSNVKNEVKGTGNGLINMNTRMVEIGGHLTIWSNPGEGTTITIICPVAYYTKV